MFDMMAVGETILQVHWPLISVAAFLIIHQGVCVSVYVCVYVWGTGDLEGFVKWWAR